MGVYYNRLAQINGRRAASCEEVQYWAHKRVTMTGGAMEASLGNCGLGSCEYRRSKAQEEIMLLLMQHIGCDNQVVVRWYAKFAKPVMLNRVVASEEVQIAALNSVGATSEQPR